MKKIVITSLVIFSSILLGTKAAQAEDTTTTQKASVELTTNTDPNELLKIKQASSLDFGTKAITTEALNFTEDHEPTIVVQDIRGVAKGWNIKVGLGEFKQTNAETGATANVLKGVKLFYPTPSFETTETAINTDKAPVGVTNATDVSFTDSNVKGVLLDAAATPSSKVLINSVTGTGNGLWTATYGAGSSNKVELQVPAGNLAGKYEAALTYTLTDGPAA